MYHPPGILKEIKDLRESAGPFFLLWLPACGSLKAGFWTMVSVLSIISIMDKISASTAKQNFGEALERAASGPLGIEKHGKLVAALVPPEWLERASLLDERRLAREQQKLVEQSRLMAHQKIAIELLADESRQRQLLGAASKEVRRWSEKRLCSQDYIDRWSEWLALPVQALVRKMCSDADGWGTAMRQNSPFGVAFP